mmetsp:Transcript_11906/g.32768  ORF Transcript_11906/g.32768 Transcript_11906/m.32768 type:complete len:106 (-) Transcript_11906:1228-1545(-)
MVRVWYEPPPYGPRTHLNRPSPYYMETEAMPTLLKRLSKARPMVSVGLPVLAISVLCYIPLMNQKLPVTMNPEYQAAQRAYMRYHNMNPIYGISSKQSRAADPDP